MFSGTKGSAERNFDFVLCQKMMKPRFSRLLFIVGFCNIPKIVSAQAFQNFIFNTMKKRRGSFHHALSRQMLILTLYHRVDLYPYFDQWLYLSIWKQQLMVVKVSVRFILLYFIHNDWIFDCSESISKPRS